MKVVVKKKEEKKKLYFLIALGLVGGYLFYDNVIAGDSTPASTNKPGIAAVAAEAGSTTVVQRRGTTASREWKAYLPGHRPGDPDVTKVDPTLRLDLLAKVQNVQLEGGSRNLFQFGQAAPPPVSLTPIPKEKKIPLNPVQTFTPPPPPPPGPPVQAAPAPIPLKYYGFSNTRGNSRKKAFFLDGEEIIVALEGETVLRGRYRVVRVGISSVDMEDTQTKNKQTLPLAEEAVIG